MERYGNDRPDLRYGVELKDVADIAAETEFKVFQAAREAGHRIRGLCAAGGGEKYSRKDLDGLTEFANTFGTKGLVWLKVDAEAMTGPTAKFFPPDAQARLRERFGAKAGRPDPDRRRHAGRHQPGADEPADAGWPTS